MKKTAAKINSQVCLARKPIACPAVLKIKLTIEPISPGRIEPSFEPMSLRPFPIEMPEALRALVRAPTTEAIVATAERTIAVIVKPCFLKISRTLSRRDIALSILPCSRSSSSFLSAILPSAACLSDGVVFSSWMIF